MHTTSKLNFTPFRCLGASLYLQSKPFFSSDIKCVLDWHRSSGHSSQAEQKGYDSVPSFGWSCFYQHFTLVYFSFENIYLWQNLVIDFVHIFNFHSISMCMETGRKHDFAPGYENFSHNNNLFAELRRWSHNSCSEIVLQLTFFSGIY